MRGELAEVVVAHRDRIARFAFELVEYILEQNGVALVVLDRNGDTASPESDLANDLLSIVHIFSCRQMGRRRYHKKGEVGPDVSDGNEAGEVSANAPPTEDSDQLAKRVSVHV
jgi:predicted site-specific integrase-resolvase